MECADAAEEEDALDGRGIRDLGRHLWAKRCAAVKAARKALPANVIPMREWANGAATRRARVTLEGTPAETTEARTLPDEWDDGPEDLFAPGFSE